MYINCADPPVWLQRLMSACLLPPSGPTSADPHHHHHHHSTVFASLETLLSLLDWQLLPLFSGCGSGSGGHVHGPAACPLPSSFSTSTFGPCAADASSAMRSNFLSKSAVDHVLLNIQFEKVLIIICHYYHKSGNFYCKK